MNMSTKQSAVLLPPYPARFANTIDSVKKTCTLTPRTHFAILTRRLRSARHVLVPLDVMADCLLLKGAGGPEKVKIRKTNPFRHFASVLGGPDFSPGLKALILKERNPD